MLMPSIFGETLLDDFFGFPTLEGRKATSNTNGLMQTDIKEKANEYCVTMNLPGFKKEDIKGEIKDGYLVITASTNTENEDKDEDGKYVKSEGLMIPEGTTEIKYDRLYERKISTGISDCETYLR